MPELPEVEAVVRTLRPFVQGKRILCVHVFHPIAVKPQAGHRLAELATGRRVHRVERKGKYVLLTLDRGLLTLHFKLDGQLVWFADGKELLDRANVPEDGVHVDVAFELSNGVLGFADRRHFGRVYAWGSLDESPGLASMGVDALSKGFTAATFKELLARSVRPLKDFLLDQTRFAGLGNIYSCESLWHAQLDPRRRAKSVKPHEARRLHKAIVSVLRRALECCLHPAPDFRDSQWWFQGLEKILRAYGREGEPCRRCGAEIQRIEQGGRSTYWCRRCQK
ncbi:MAG TPA: bifunctional DNA-formamidopyrimidine glycosylase/DNA-(apurinic or apyrimidinic site) lyase [Candidatus Acidoferrum sp.]|nr:bifunctional DNA-formamidopyrimidine glycosylase/DNA-(apurinic or apyrimidinic site) lyase [Candidatus Acidoferrum sp.]